MKARASLDPILSDHQLVVCVGPGGVGKTTVAASMGLRAASLGRRVLVLTIDPAKRLADALGLKELDDEIREVPLDRLRGDGFAASGSLHAAMFDHGTGMDTLMARMAPDPQTREQILSNRVYRAMAGSLARSHAYLAMERLLEVMQEDRYDLVILDTPPARNALDILDAPGRLATFLEEGVIQWFVRRRQAKGLRGRLLQSGGAAATKLFGMVVGQAFLSETIAFFEAFYELRHGFRERAQSVSELMRSDDASFVLVSSTDSTHLQDARALARGILDRGVPIASVVFNRAYESLSDNPFEIIVDLPSSKAPMSSLSGHPRSPARAKRRKRTRRRNDPKKPGPLADPAASAPTAGRAGNRRAEEAQRTLDGVLSPACFPVFIARFEDDICDLDGLRTLSSYLADPDLPRSQS